jgi:hypothetical protein
MSRTVELVCRLWLFPCSHRSHRSAGLLVAMAPSWNRMKVGTSSRHLFLSAFHQKPIETICNMKQYEKIWHNWTIYYILHNPCEILPNPLGIEWYRMPKNSKSDLQDWKSAHCWGATATTLGLAIARAVLKILKCLHQLGDPSTSQRFLKGGTSMTGM